MEDPSKPKDSQSPEHTADPTIVGGRPPGRGRASVQIPQGIEVLLKKASVDTEFRRKLIEQRAAAAAEIGLELSAAEIAMLNAVPQAQIEQIIKNTTVPNEQRRVFLGKIGAAMLGLITLPLSAKAWEFDLKGCTADRSRYFPFFRYKPKPWVKQTFDPIFDQVRGARSGEPRMPEELEPKDETLRIPSFEHLRVEIRDGGKGAVAVKLDYDCPFDIGDIEILCGIGPETPSVTATCAPERLRVSKGTGEAVFSIEGKGGTTEGLLVRLVSTAEQCKKGPCERRDLNDFELRLPDFEPGEYFVDGCVIYRVVKFTKVWPS